jgi:hypothetical protein
MNNNLKKYTEFINEELTADPKLSDSELSQRLTGGPDSMIGKKNEEKFLFLRYKFWDNIIDMTEDLRPRSFSDMCKRNTNPEEDYKELQSLMDKKGWDIQSIKNLFSPQVDEICGYGIGDLVEGKTTDKFNSILAKLNSQRVNTSTLSNIQDPFRNISLDEQNGHTDIYLYFTFNQLGLNPDFIGLGGEGWSTFTDKEEIIIRYRYGYHHTKYGQMMLKQMNYSQEEFREKALESLQEIIFDEWHTRLFSFYKETKKDVKDIREVSRFIDSLKLEEYSIIEDDRMIIYTKEIANDINKVFPNFTDEKEICSAFTKFLSDFNLDIDFTGNELIINSKFQEI